MGLEPGTWAYRVERSTAEPQNGDAKIKSSGRDDNVPSPKKMPSVQIATQTRTQKHETPPFPGIPSVPGDRTSRPREGTFPRPPLAEFAGGAPSFAGETEGCSVGGGRGAVAWTRGSPCGRRSWRGRADARGPRESRCPAGRTETEYILKI